jgi:hypothetical protein
MLMHMFINYLLRTLILVVVISPPLLSLFLLRRPSFWRVPLHVATTIYILWIAVAFFTASTPLGSLGAFVTFIFLLVYSIAALVAGLLEATAAGRRARLVYYAALLLWSCFLLYLTISTMGQIGKFA